MACVAFTPTYSTGKRYFSGNVVTVKAWLGREVWYSSSQCDWSGTASYPIQALFGDVGVESTVLVVVRQGTL